MFLVREIQGGKWRPYFYMEALCFLRFMEKDLNKQKQPVSI